MECRDCWGALCTILMRHPRSNETSQRVSWQRKAPVPKPLGATHIAHTCPRQLHSCDMGEAEQAHAIRPPRRCLLLLPRWMQAWLGPVAQLPMRCRGSAYSTKGIRMWGSPHMVSTHSRAAALPPTHRPVHQPLRHSEMHSSANEGSSPSHT